MEHPLFGSPVHVVSSTLPDDSDAATAITIARMEVLSTDAVPYVGGVLQSLGCSAADVQHCAAAIHQFVRGTVEFVTDGKLARLFGVGGDPEAVELLIRPDALLQMPNPREDCDGFSMLVMSLFKAAGVPASFATVAADERMPENYSHVYVVAHGPGGDIPVDASHGKHAGWAAPNRFGKLKVWKTGMFWNTLAPSSALSGLGYDDYSDWLASVFGPSQETTTPTFTATGTTKKPSIFEDLLRQGADTANYILKNRLTPPVLVKNADGSVTIRTPVGVDASNPYSSSAPQYQQQGTQPAANQLPTWALPVGVGVLALVLITSITKKK